MGNLQIELSTVCNLDCVYCPRPFLKRTKSYISLAVFSKALDMFLEKTSTLILSKDGEPLIHPEFNEIIKIISEKYKSKIDIYTNGMFLDENKLNIIGALFNEIHIFVTDHPLGRNGIQDSSKSLNNFKNAVERNYPNIKFYLTKHSFGNRSDENLAWLTSWQSYKSNHSNIVAVHLNTCKNSWAGFIDPSKNDYCSFMEYEFIGVGITGNVCMCCVDLNEELVVGNVMLDDKQTILNSWENYRKRIINKDIANIQPCNRCIKEIQ